MTETSPVCAIGHPPKDMDGDDEVTWRARTGRIMPGVELRITDDSGDDGAVGRRVARRDRGARAVDHRLVLPRRRSREVPRRLAAHRRRRLGLAQRLRDDQRPGQGRHQVGRRVGVVGRPREHADGPSRRRSRQPSSACPTSDGTSGRWRASCASPTRRSPPTSCAAWLVRAHRQVLAARAVDVHHEVPKTSVGKFDKKVLRARHAADQLEVETLAVGPLAPAGLRLAAARQCGGQTVRPRVPKVGVDPLTFEQLLERLGCLRDRVLGEEALHVGHDVRLGERRDRADHPHDGVVGEALEQLRPLPADASPMPSSRAGGWRCSGSAGTARPAS